MAKRSQSISWLIPGISAIVFIVAMVFTALIALLYFAFQHDSVNVLLDHYLWRVLLFTIIQAALSSVISILLAIMLAKALYHCHFFGKQIVLRILAISFVLPALVVVTGLMTIYGRNGWLAYLCHWLGIEYQFSIYGLNGILLAHVFLNFPFAARLFYQTLILIPNEQKQLAEQLGLNHWQTFRYLEWPLLLRLVLPLCGLIFMMCFSSFAIVLALSGGPKYTTIEVAIYQSIRDFELFQAGILSFIQLFICLGFVLLLKRFTPAQTPELVAKNSFYQVKNPLIVSVLGTIVIIFSLSFILTPFLGIMSDGLRFFSANFLTALLLQAVITSVSIALCSGMLALLLAIAILWTNSHLQVQHYNKSSELLMMLGSIMLAIPSMVLAAGFFLLFYFIDDVSYLLPLLIIVSNSFLALPFLLKYLEPATTDLAKRYTLLSQSLNIQGFNYLYFIEFKALKKLIAYSFAFACIMSMGDFGIIAFFGDEGLVTLPYYLYGLLSRYRQEEAAFVAAILLLISFAIITLFDYTKTNYANTKND